MKVNKLLFSAVILGGMIGTASFTEEVSAHGFVSSPASRVVKGAENGFVWSTGNDSILNNPQGVEAPTELLDSGDLNGHLASAAKDEYKSLDLQTSTRWVKENMATGDNQISWHHTAIHRTNRHRYYMTKQGWDQNAPLTLENMELITVVGQPIGKDLPVGEGPMPSVDETHNINIPSNRSGYHVIYSVWDINDTVMSFYQAIDVNIISGGEIELDVTAPTIPEGLKSDKISHNSVDLSWAPSVDTDSGVKEYQILRDGKLAGTSKTTSFSDLNVKAETAYEYTIKAVDNAGNISKESEKLKVTTKDEESAINELPSAPTNLHSMEVTKDSVSLMWGASSHSEGIKTYQILRDGEKIAETSKTMYTDSKLLSNTEYNYTVVAVSNNDLISEESDKLTVTTEKEGIINPDEDADLMPDISKEKVMVGYYQNWASYGDGYLGGTAKSMELTDVSEDYNVVDVAFMKGDTLPTFTPYNMTDEEFKQQVGDLNAEGRAVIISLGGADAHISLHKGQEKELANRIIELVTKYGFDGLDIDLEQNAITEADNQTVIPDALKIVKDHYKKEGKNFLITMAPEFPYLRNGGAYESYITQLEGYYDFIAPQLYNQAGDGVSTSEGWFAQNNDEKKYEFLSGMAESLNNGSNGFIKIPAEKLVLGLPSNNDGAANGFVKNPQDVYRTFKTMKDQGHELKGIMTWSVNWDEGVDRSGVAYNGQFAKDYSELIHGEGSTTNPEVPETDVTAPTIPGSLKADNVSHNSVDLSWAPSVDAESGVKEYQIFRDGKLVGTSKTTNFTDLDVKAETTYDYTIKAVDNAGNISKESEKLTVVTEKEEIANPDTDFSKAVTNLRVENGQVVFDIDEAYYKEGNRVILDVNNKYAGELYKGNNYHALKKLRTQDGKITFGFTQAVKASDEIRVRLSDGKPGGTSNILEAKTLVVTDQMLHNDFYTAISNFKLEKDEFNFDMEKDYYQGTNRVKIYVNDKYEAEVYNGRTYYKASAKVNEENVTIRLKNKALVKGDKVAITYSRLTPGQLSEAVMSREFIVTDNGLTENIEVAENAWNPETTYNEGDIVTYKTGTFQAKYWTVGDTPDQSSVWKLIDGTQQWSANKEYDAGDKVVYNGNTYEAAYWVVGEKPDASSVWSLVK